MKRWYLIPILAMALVMMNTGQSAAFQNEPPGFRGVAWETDVSEVPGLILVEEHGDVKDYIKKKEKLVLGEANLTQVRYSFYKDRFFRVLISYDAPWNYEELKDKLFQVFGPGHKWERDYKTYWWFGDKVTIGLQYAVFARGGTISYIYLPIQEQRDKDEFTAAGQGSEGF